MRLDAGAALRSDGSNEGRCKAVIGLQLGIGLGKMANTERVLEPRCSDGEGGTWSGARGDTGRVGGGKHQSGHSLDAVPSIARTQRLYRAAVRDSRTR